MRQYVYITFRFDQRGPSYLGKVHIQDLMKVEPLDRTETVVQTLELQKYEMNHEFSEIPRNRIQVSAN